MTEQIIAMRQALNFILATGEHDPNCGAFDLDEEGRHCVCTCGLRKTIDTLRTAIEATEKQEPVAYINVEQRKLEWAKYTKWDTPTVVNLPKIPLYTTPQPQRDEAPAKAVDDVSAKAAKWVGLGGMEIETILTEQPNGEHINLHWFYNAVQTIEAKLKQKNGYAEEKNT